MNNFVPADDLSVIWYSESMVTRLRYHLLIAGLVALLFAPPVVFATADQNPADAWQTVSSSVRYSVNGGCSAKLEGDQLSVEGSGAILAEPTAGTLSIKTSLATVLPKHGSLVFIRSAKGIEHIFVILGDAVLVVNDHKANLKAGDEMIISNHQPAYKDLVGMDDIPRRQIRIHTVAADRICTSTEFSLIHIAEREQLVYRVLHSGDRADKSLRERLIKTATVLSIVTTAHGPYMPGVP